jgi:hypothetical protein
MSVSCGIVGFPNVGKSTLFNAVLKKQLAFIANYPFATIESNEGIVQLVDPRVDKLAEMSHSAKKIYSTVKFIDIAGLVKGASTGAGLGNKFLSHIREVDLILFVLRGFNDESVVREGSTEPKSDFEVLKTELCLKDLETVEKAKNEKRKVKNEKLDAVLVKIGEALNGNKLISQLDFHDGERELIKEYCFLTDKPYLILLNTDEDSVGVRHDEPLPNVTEDAYYVSAKMENELASLSPEEQGEYLQSLGLNEQPLNRVIKAAFDKLHLIQFFTTGPDETRSWTIVEGSKAPQAAGTIHTDFEKGFIKADIVTYEDFVKCGSWVKCREAGRLRVEGREYVMKDGDIAEFKFN